MLFSIPFLYLLFMKVKSIEKKRKYFLITLDNDNYLIRYETFVKYKISLDLEIDNVLLKEIIKDSNTYDIKDKVFDLISRRLHTKRELKQKLLKKGFAENLIDEILDYLQDNGYIDEKQFANEYVNELIRKRNSKFMIINKLKQKGINEEIIEEVLLNKFSDDLEIENGIKLVQKKLRLLTNKTPLQKKQAIIQYLLNKGYNYDIVKVIIEKINNI